MEDVNMSQSAEQTAIGNVPPSGQDGVKRQVSADAFRALTQRLNAKASPAPIPAIVQLPEPEPVMQPVAEVIVEPIPTVEPVIETTIDQVAAVESVIETKPATAQPSQMEPPIADLTENNIVVPESQESVESAFVQQIEQKPPAAVAPEQLVPVAPIETMATTEVVSPNVEINGIGKNGNVSAQHVEPSQAPAQFAMPASGTKIILGAVARPKPKKPVQQVPAEPIAITEAIQPGEIDSFDKVSEIPSEIINAEPKIEPVAVTIDPLQAAMNLMNATGMSTEMDDRAFPVITTVPTEFVAPITPVPLSETAAEALSQEFSTPETAEPVSQDEPTAKEIDIAPFAPVAEETPAQSSQVAKQPTVHAPPVIGDANDCLPELEPDAQSGETARALLDIMSSGSQPQERALAADTLLQLIPRMMVRDLVALADRVCMMEDAPPLLVKALINHRDAKVAAPLLEDGKVIVEQDLLRLIATTEVERLIMMAKHRKVTQTVCDALIARGEPSVYLTLVRNPGAALSHDAFVAFSEIAKSQSSLQAPLATRGDTPPPIAFELFWSLPVELRRYVLSRFLTDSATLDKILKITQSVDGSSSGEHKFPPARKVEELVDLIADGVTDQAVAVLAKLLGTNQDNARRIIADPDGEPLTVVLKTMGLTRAQFSQAIKKCASSSKTMLRSDRDLTELQIMFDSLSFNKARTLLTYWDWAIEKTGPYSRRVM